MEFIVGGAVYGVHSGRLLALILASSFTASLFARTASVFPDTAFCALAALILGKALSIRATLLVCFTSIHTPTHYAWVLTATAFPVRPQAKKVAVVITVEEVVTSIIVTPFTRAIVSDASSHFCVARLATLFLIA